MFPEQHCFVYVAAAFPLCRGVLVSFEPFLHSLVAYPSVNPNRFGLLDSSCLSSFFHRRPIGHGVGIGVGESDS